MNALAALELKIEPAKLELAPEKSKQLKVTRIYVGSRAEDVTATVQWSSSNPIVSVDGYGVAKVGGIGGDPFTAEISAVDPQTNLTAKIEVLVKLPDDLTLEITPATVTLAPGGSAQFNAKRVGPAGRAVDVTAKVLWRPSSAAISFDAAGVAKASHDLSQSETVDITVIDLEMDLTTKVLAWVKVPSHEIRRFKTPFGQILYFAGFEDQAKPRLENATKAFLLAEQSGSTMDEAREKVGAPSEQEPGRAAECGRRRQEQQQQVQGRGRQCRGRSDLSTEEVQQIIDIVSGLIDDVKKGHIASAEAKLKNAKDTTQLHDLQSRIKAYNELIDIITTSLSTISSFVIGNPISMVSAVAFEVGMMLEADEQSRGGRG